MFSFYLQYIWAYLQYHVSIVSSVTSKRNSKFVSIVQQYLGRACNKAKPIINQQLQKESKIRLFKNHTIDIGPSLIEMTQV